MFTCPFKKFFHMDCPGCGFQRSVLQLFKGNVSESLHLFPATVPLMIMVIFTLLHAKFQFRHGAAIVQFLYITCTIIVVVAYIYKLINNTAA